MESVYKEINVENRTVFGLSPVFLPHTKYFLFLTNMNGECNIWESLLDVRKPRDEVYTPYTPLSRSTRVLSHLQQVILFLIFRREF